MKDGPDILIRLRPLPRDGSRYRRLARLLKAMKRGYGFICVEIEEVKDGTAHGDRVGNLATRPEVEEAAKDGDGRTGRD